MMLKVRSGAIATGLGFAPSGPSHAEKASPASLSSSATRCTASASPVPFSARAGVAIQQQDLCAAVFQHHHEARRAWTMAEAARPRPPRQECRRKAAP